MRPAEDAILLVAVAEVTAGVDLQKLTADDVVVDPAAAAAMSCQVSRTSGRSQPYLRASPSLTPTAIGDSMIFFCSFTRAWPCGLDSRYLALANHAACAFASPVNTASVLSIVPPQRNFIGTPVAVRTMRSSCSMSRRSVVARTTNSAGGGAGGGGGGAATLAFAGASTPQDQRDIDAVLAAATTSTSSASTPFAATWLRHRGLHWAADLLSSFPSPRPKENPS